MTSRPVPEECVIEVFTLVAGALFKAGDPAPLKNGARLTARVVGLVEEYLEDRLRPLTRAARNSRPASGPRSETSTCDGDTTVTQRNATPNDRVLGRLDSPEIDLEELVRRQRRAGILVVLGTSDEDVHLTALPARGTPGRRDVEKGGGP